jgi:NADH:ubiquinone oxidoreductase subunit 6 (subunit J)
MISVLLEVVGAGLLISACLAIFLDEAVYSVAALASTLMLTSLLYALNNAIYVALFQFAVGVGTLAILFLSGEMLSEKPDRKTPRRTTVLVVVMGVILWLPALFLSIPAPGAVGTTIPFGEALWDLRATDVLLQGLVILSVALGIAIVLYEKKKNGGKRLGEK